MRYICDECDVNNIDVDVVGSNTTATAESLRHTATDSTTSHLQTNYSFKCLNIVLSPMLPSKSKTTEITTATYEIPIL